MRIAAQVEVLRARVHAVRGTCSLQDLSLAIGISHITLAQFLAGVNSTRVPLLDKIERWVEEEENAQQAPGSLPAEP